MICSKSSIVSPRSVMMLYPVMQCALPRGIWPDSYFGYWGHSWLMLNDRCVRRALSIETCFSIDICWYLLMTSSIKKVQGGVKQSLAGGFPAYRGIFCSGEKQIPKKYYKK